MKDEFKTIKDLSEGVYKEKGSKFLGYAIPVLSESEIEEAIIGIHKMHPKARHHCYAYRLGIDGNKYRSNDDGEPSGTAGLPIMGQLKSFDLTDVILIVVRYFGGTKLGAAGLIRAYKNSAEDALQKAHIVQKYLSSKFKLKTNFTIYPNLIERLKKMDIPFNNLEYTNEGVQLFVEIRQSKIDSIFTKIIAGLLHRNEQDIEDAFDFPEILKIEMLEA